MQGEVQDGLSLSWWVTTKHRLPAGSKVLCCNKRLALLLDFCRGGLFSDWVFDDFCLFWDLLCLSLFLKVTLLSYGGGKLRKIDVNWLYFGVGEGRRSLCLSDRRKVLYVFSAWGVKYLFIECWFCTPMRFWNPLNTLCELFFIFTHFVLPNNIWSRWAEIKDKLFWFLWMK